MASRTQLGATSPRGLSARDRCRPLFYLGPRKPLSMMSRPVQYYVEEGKKEEENTKQIAHYAESSGTRLRPVVRHGPSCPHWVRPCIVRSPTAEARSRGRARMALLLRGRLQQGSTSQQLDCPKLVIVFRFRPSRFSSGTGSRLDTFAHGFTPGTPRLPPRGACNMTRPCSGVHGLSRSLDSPGFHQSTPVRRR